MFPDWCYVRLRDRAAREQELDERRGFGTARKPALRARMARGLCALAVATEREETWRVVWERLEAEGSL